VTSLASGQIEEARQHIVFAIADSHFGLHPRVVKPGTPCTVVAPST